MKRTDSHPVSAPISPSPWLEGVGVLAALASLAMLFHGGSLFCPSIFAMSPADVMLRQPELGGSAHYVPQNRLLIDPVLQFEPWEALVGQEAAAGRFAWWNPFSGTGAPLAANGQSRMFDPLAWAFRMMPGGRNVAAESAATFILCGLGTWLLAHALGGGPWVRIWAGILVPLTGYFTFWRLYPLNSAATSIPWLWLATVRLHSVATFRALAVASLAVAWILAAGNVQVAAVGFCGAAILTIANLPQEKRGHSGFSLANRLTRVWPVAVAFAFGLAMAAPAWVGLLDYLGNSPVWADRQAEHSGEGRGAKPRWADLPCLFLPFVYGSERRGDANVAKAAGASNVNEAGSGHPGLVAAAVLVPIAISSIAGSVDPLKRLAAMLAFCGLWISFRLPPVDIIWHRLPVFQGIDPRRFVILATFAGMILAGTGLRDLAEGRPGRRFDRLAPRFWVVVAFGCFAVATLPWLVQGKLAAQARRHYEAAVPPGPDHDRIVAVRVADQIQGLTRSWPAYMAGRGLWLLAIATAWIVFRNMPHRRALAIGLIGGLELITFGWGYNPRVEPRELARRFDMRLIETSRKLAATARAQGHEARFLAVGECLPPNQLMRFGLKDLRNYDSIELSATLNGVKDLFEPQDRADTSSRRPITWAGVRRAAQSLQDRGVIGVIGLTKPDDGLFDRILEPLPGVFLGVWQSVPKVDGPGRLIEERCGAMLLRLDRNVSGKGDRGDSRAARTLRIRESYDAGWRVDERFAPFVHLEPEAGTGLIRCVVSPEFEGEEIRLTYRPLWFDRTIVPAAIAGLFCAAGLVAPSGTFRKKGCDVLFRPTDEALESKNLR